MVPDPQGGSGKEGGAVSVTGGTDSLGCLNCQGAEQTLGGSSSVLCGGMAALSHASKLTDRFGLLRDSSVGLAFGFRTDVMI